MLCSLQAESVMWDVHVSDDSGLFHHRWKLGTLNQAKHPGGGIESSRAKLTVFSKPSG